MISWVRSFTESYLSDIDNIAPFENTAPVMYKRTQSRLIRVIVFVFSNSAVLSVSDKFDSVNESTQELSELMKLHIQWVWQNAHKLGNWLIMGSCASLIEPESAKRMSSHVVDLDLCRSLPLLCMTDFDL